MNLTKPNEINYFHEFGNPQVDYARFLWQLPSILGLDIKGGVMLYNGKWLGSHKNATLPLPTATACKDGLCFEGRVNGYDFLKYFNIGNNFQVAPMVSYYPKLKHVNATLRLLGNITPHVQVGVDLPAKTIVNKRYKDPLKFLMKILF